MKINTYRAVGLQKLVLYLQLKGGVRQIVLSGGTSFPKRWGMFRTSDKNLQAALEKHPSFGKTFVLEDTQWVKEDKPEVEDHDGINKPLEFNNFNELRDYLIKEKGKAPITVSTMAKAEREMQKLELKYIIK